jgi:outer membrane protein OmpA-like peptidoglycan-associated protein
MYPGEDVIVNPVPGSGVLLYPGGKYGRVVHPLLQPGAPYPGANEAPIHLHMPYKHVAHRVKKAPAAPPTAVATAAPPVATTLDQSPPEAATNIPGLDTSLPQPVPQRPAAAPKPAAAKPAVAHVVKPAPAPQIEQYAASLPAQAPKPTMPQGFRPAVAQTSKPAAAFVPQAASAPVPKPAAAQAPKPVVAQAAKPQPAAGPAASIPFSLAPEPGAAPAPQPTRVASNQPPPAHTPPATPMSSDLATNGLVRQSQILFGPGAPDPVPEAIDAIKGLANPLNSALAAGATRVQVVAYGGAKGDKSSDARRLSLKRALIIRQLLIDGGVPSGRIDVRAMGGTTDSEPTDRVDIFTKA